eukprot:4908112-Amphidinium_carterae.1
MGPFAASLSMGSPAQHLKLWSWISHDRVSPEKACRPGETNRKWFLSAHSDNISTTAQAACVNTRPASSWTHIAMMDTTRTTCKT